MKKFVAFAAVATALSFSAAPAMAGGWGSSGWGQSNQVHSSSGLINVSPSVQTGNVNVLSGILNNSPILSGNNVLSGNNTGIGILGTGTGLLNNVVGITNLGGGGNDAGRGGKRR